MQELPERSRLGIPMVFKSNARNHIDPDTRFGISEAAGAFTAFPKFLKEAGLAAAALGEEAAALGEEAARTGKRPAGGDMSVIAILPASWERNGRPSAFAACTATWPTSLPSPGGRPEGGPIETRKRERL